MSPASRFDAAHRAACTSVSDVKILSSVFSPLKLFGVFEEYSEYPSVIKYCHQLSAFHDVSCI